MRVLDSRAAAWRQQACGWRSCRRRCFELGFDGLDLRDRQAQQPGLVDVCGFEL
jgi:hypothetical protein